MVRLSCRWRMHRIIPTKKQHSLGENEPSHTRRPNTWLIHLITCLNMLWRDILLWQNWFISKVSDRLHWDNKASAREKAKVLRCVCRKTFSMEWERERPLNLFTTSLIFRFCTHTQQKKQKKQNKTNKCNREKIKTHPLYRKYETNN